MLDSDQVLIAARVLGFDTVAEALAAAENDRDTAKLFGIMVGANDAPAPVVRQNSRERRHAKRDRERTAVARENSRHPGRDTSRKVAWSPRISQAPADKLVTRLMLVEGPALPGKPWPVRIIHPDVLKAEQELQRAEAARKYQQNGWAH